MAPMTNKDLGMSVVKPVAVFATSYAIDNLFYGTPMSISAGFAAVNAVTIWGVGLGASYIPDWTAGFLANGKTVEQRLLEIVVGTGVAYGINRAMNDINNQTIIQRATTILISDIVGEYVSDGFAGRPLSFF